MPPTAESCGQGEEGGWFSNYPITKLLNYSITRSPESRKKSDKDGQRRVSNYQITQLPNYKMLLSLGRDRGRPSRALHASAARAHPTSDDVRANTAPAPRAIRDARGRPGGCGGRGAEWLRAVHDPCAQCAAGSAPRSQPARAAQP